MKKRLTVFLACMLLSLGAALAQNKITGTVYEDNGEPCIEIGRASCRERV